MAKKAKKVKTAKGAELRIVNPDAAGIDIADGIMQVCVPADRSKDNNRAFGAYTSDLHAISAWLRECGIKTVAMESTGVYWIPLFCRLQEDGLDVVLTNARDGEEHNGEENRRVGCRMADVAAPVRVAQGKFPTAQRRQTDEDTHPSP